MKKRLATCIHSVLFLTLSTSSLTATESRPAGALKWAFNTHGSVTAAPTIAKDGKVYVSTVDVDAASKKKRYYARSLTPGQGGGEAIQNWRYLFYTAAVTTSPALSVDEKIIYVTSNNINSASTPTAQLTALDSITDGSAGYRTETFNKGEPITLPASVIGAPKVVPDTGNIIVNTLDKTDPNYLEQNLRIYRKDGSAALLPFQLSLFTDPYGKAEWSDFAWLDFEHREPALNGRGGAAQIVTDTSFLFPLLYRYRFHIADYWYDTAQSVEWSSWKSKRSYYEPSSLPHLAVDTSNQRFYILNGNALSAYKKDGGFLWTNPAPKGVTLAAITPTIATSDSDTADAKSAFARAGTLYLGDMNGHVYGLTPSNVGTTLLFNWPISTAALDKRMVIDNTDGILYAVDAKGALFALDLRAETSESEVPILWKVEDADITTAPAVSRLDGSVVVGSGNQVKAYVGGRSTA